MPCTNSIPVSVPRSLLNAAALVLAAWCTPTPAAATDSSGTGFFVGAEGHIVTSYHVIEGAESVTVYTASGRELPAIVERGSRAIDVAILGVNLRPNEYLTLAKAGTAKAGDRVFTFGFPVTGLLGLEAKFTEGAVSSLSGLGGEPTFMQMSVPVQPGNSGGPLVNEKGEVVGIVAAGAAIKPFMEATGTLPQNVNWTVRSEFVAPLLLSPGSAAAQSRDAAIARARGSVVRVVASKKEAVEPARTRAAETADGADAALAAGTQMWVENRYSEAQEALERFVREHPQHKRTGMARHVLGRAYLDGGKPATAAKVFLSHFQTMPGGEYAAESLLFLGSALLQLGKPVEACQVYDEIREVYGRKVSQLVREQLPRASVAARCR